MRYLTRTNSIFPTFDDLFNFPSMKEFSINTMQCDISKRDGNYVIDIDLPGYNKENIAISLEEGYITVEAKQSTTNETTKEGYIHQERFLGSTSRSFYVGEAVKEEDIKAAYRNGTLTLTIPEVNKQLEEVSPKYITIE